MKSINEFLKELLASGDLQAIINDIDGTVFDSHQFIQHFAKRHESEYLHNVIVRQRLVNSGVYTRK